MRVKTFGAGVLAALIAPVLTIEPDSSQNREYDYVCLLPSIIAPIYRNKTNSKRYSASVADGFP